MHLKEIGNRLMLRIRSNPRPHPDFDTGRMVHRRQRLSADYQFLTRAKLEAHNGRTHIAKKALSKCCATLRRPFLPHYFSSPPPWRLRMRRLVKERALPDFCIIGPVKCGTSDLAVTIMSHPNVLHPLAKEISSADPLEWRPFYPTLKSVQRHAKQHGVALCAYVAPYLHCHDIPIVLSSIRPDTKIVINLRNPVELVFSVWKWSVLHNEKKLTNRLPFFADFSAYVEKALELFPEVHMPFGDALHCGIYATSVAHWLRHFGPENLRVFDVAEYFRDRNEYFERLELFLGIPHVSLPQQLPIANQNPLKGLAPTPEATAQLRAFFEPYNRRLWDVIGKTFPW